MALSFALVDVNGVERALDDSTGVHVAMGSKGLGMPSISVSGDKLPYAPGETPRQVATPASVLDIPIYIEAATSALLDALLDTVRGWVLPGTERRTTPRTVLFRVTRDDGAEREIEGVYGGGLEGDDLAGVETWQDGMLSLFCPDPYWRDIAATEVTFTSGTGVRSWFPYWPYDLTPSSVFAEQTITNGGQVEAWPVWTITGPGSNPTLANLTTGEELSLVMELGAGDVVTIDTSESGATAKTIRDQNGANLWPLATPLSVMWPLEVGGTDVRVSLAGATVASSVELAYRRRWAGGHR